MSAERVAASSRVRFEVTGVAVPSAEFWPSQQSRSCSGRLLVRPYPRPADCRSQLSGRRRVHVASSAPQFSARPVGLHSHADLNHPASLCCTSYALASAIDPHLARRIWPARRIWDPRSYQILRVTRIHHANRRELWRMRLKRLLVHQVDVAACPGAAPFHDPEGSWRKRIFEASSVTLKELAVPADHAFHH